MQIINQPVSKADIASMTGVFFDDMVKAVVDVRREVIAVDAELHADLEKLLLQEGSVQTDLWGINFFPEYEGEDFIEYDALINIRSYQGNPSRDVLDPQIRERIRQTVDRLIV